MAEDEEGSPCFLWTAYDPCVQDAVFEYAKTQAGPNNQVRILRTESPSDDLNACTLFGYLVNALRKRQLFPNWCTTVLTIPEYYQALHLCTARVKQRSGKFYAVGSEVLYADFLYKKHLQDKDMPVESEYVQEFLDFLSHSNTLNNWQVLKAFKGALEDDRTFAEHIAKSVYLVHGPVTEDFTKECIELLLQGRKPRRIVTEAPLDMSVNENYDFRDVSVHADVSVVPEPDASTVKLDSNTAEYTMRIVNAFLRILVNSRDELALATAMASPVIQLPHVAFTELKRLSVEKKSPMCQTAVSYVMRARLGGDSCAAPEDYPLKPYVCKLAAFVDILQKLQAAIEEEPTMVAIGTIVGTLARRIRSTSGHGLVWETVVCCKTELVQLAQRFHDEQDIESRDGANDGTLHIDTLCILRNVSDFLSTRRTTCCPFSVIYNHNAYSTPLNIPHLLEYFKTPEPQDEDDGYDVPLTKRLSEKFEREGATHLLAILRALSDRKKRKRTIQKLPGKATSALSAHKDETKVVQMKVSSKTQSPHPESSAPKKAAKRSILDTCKKQSASSKLVGKDQARITSFFKQ